jgi:alpha-galactosidase
MSETGVGVRSGGPAPRVSFSPVLGLTASGLTAADSALPAAAPARADSNNSLGATPLMGWRNWSYIESDPTTAKIEAQATVMKSSGLLSYGYQYINVDDFYYLSNSNGPRSMPTARGRWIPASSPNDGSTPGMEAPGQLLPRRGREGRRVCDPASPVTR